MEIFSTKGLPPKLSKEYWNDAICETFTKLETDFTDGDNFQGELTSVPLGSLSYSRVRTSKSTVHHTKRHASQTQEGIYLLHLQLKSSSLNSQYGKEVSLEEGDFTLVDSAAPYSLQFEGPISMGVMRIPHHALLERISNPENFLGCKFAGISGVSGMLSQMLKSFWHQYDFGSTEMINAQLAENILDLLATSISNQTGQFIPQSSVRKIRYLQIQKFIDYNLCDPSLSPKKIAKSFDITPRYLHQIFAEYGTETIGQYILSRRLEECARHFSDPLITYVTITEIAFKWGFNSMTHFSRVFKNKYHIAPSSFRRNILTNILLKT